MRAVCILALSSYPDPRTAVALYTVIQACALVPHVPVRIIAFREIISYAVWFYRRFSLTQREVEEERGRRGICQETPESRWRMPHR